MIQQFEYDVCISTNVQCMSQGEHNTTELCLYMFNWLKNDSELTKTSHSLPLFLCIRVNAIDHLVGYEAWCTRFISSLVSSEGDAPSKSRVKKNWPHPLLVATSATAIIIVSKQSSFANDLNMKTFSANNETDDFEDGRKRESFVLIATC